MNAQVNGWCCCDILLTIIVYFSDDDDSWTSPCFNNIALLVYLHCDILVITYSSHSDNIQFHSASFGYVGQGWVKPFGA